jgi:hypothetical protein
MLAQSFTVQPGVFEFLQGENCAKAGDCYGNNPSSPYGLILVPPAPGGTLPAQPLIVSDAAGVQCYGQAGCTPTLSASWFLNADEVIVASGVTPPEVRYWGMTSYVYSRVDGGSRTQVFGSLGDSTNLMTWSSPTGSAYNAPFVVLIGANPTTLSTAQAAYLAAGTDPKSIIVMTVPGGTDTTPFVFGGDPATANEFTFLLRSALPADPDAFKAYLASPSFQALRLTPLTPVGALPQPWPAERTRGTGTAEPAALSAALDQLARAVASTVSAEGKPLELGTRLTWPTIAMPIYLGGEYCYDNRKACLGDSPDSLYSITATGMALTGDGSSFFVAIGANHTKTGKAAYTNVSLTQTAPPLLAAATAADPTFGGSAAYYFSHAGISVDPTLADELYAIRFSWHCGTAPYCIDLTDAAMAAGVWSGDPPTNDYSLAPEDSLNVTERAYLEALTGTGPSHDELIAPRVFYVH